MAQSHEIGNRYQEAAELQVKEFLSHRISIYRLIDDIVITGIPTDPSNITITEQENAA